MKYTICNQCSVVIMYCDSSAVTPVEEQAIDQFLSEVGTTLTYVTHEEYETFTCDCCGVNVESGIKRIFETF